MNIIKPNKKMDKFFQYDILISLDITTVCNLDCSYCYSKNYYNKTNDWNKNLSQENWNNIKIFLLHIKKEFPNLQLLILGGEPTLSKYFLDCVNFCIENKINMNIFTNLINISNLLKGIEICKNNNFLDNIFITASVHELIDLNDNIFFKNLNYLINNYKINLKMDLMLTLKKEYIEFYNNNFNTIEKLSKVIDINIEVIDNGNENFLKKRAKIYSKSKSNPFRKLIQLLNPSVTMNDKEISINNFILLKNKKKCYLKEFLIDYNLNILQGCTGTKIGNIHDNFNNLLIKMKNMFIVNCEITCPCYYLTQIKKELL